MKAKNLTTILCYLLIVTSCLLLVGCSRQKDGLQTLPLLHVHNQYILTDQGDTLYVYGVNLGFWLNPEGYSWLLPERQCNSPRLMNDLVCQMVGPEQAALFWRTFQERYITEDDIRYIASKGANTVRLPFHYALLTDDDYMGYTAKQGFQYMDSAVTWCRRAGLYVILDMHDCPAGQTGDNIDDSYGYPFLFFSTQAQTRFCSLWREIAQHYRNENTVLGYELMNEPIAHYFTDSVQDTITCRLEPLYARCVDSIRAVDDRHIILLGGSRWNGSFELFTGAITDTNIVYACHRYGHPADEEGIKDFIRFRDSLNVCMVMTETGHRNQPWLEQQAATLRRNNIGLTWWPYKKLRGSSWMRIGVPDDWQLIQQFAIANRADFASIRTHRPDPVRTQKALNAFLDSMLFVHCHPDTIYSNL